MNRTQTSSSSRKKTDFRGIDVFTTIYLEILGPRISQQCSRACGAYAEEVRMFRIRVVFEEVNVECIPTLTYWGVPILNSGRSLKKTCTALDLADFWCEHSLRRDETIDIHAIG